jgi:hypothetical protein
MYPLSFMPYVLPLHVQVLGSGTLLPQTRAIGSHPSTVHTCTTDSQQLSLALFLAFLRVRVVPRSISKLLSRTWRGPRGSSATRTRVDFSTCTPYLYSRRKRTETKVVFVPFLSKMEQRSLVNAAPALQCYLRVASQLQKKKTEFVSSLPASHR